MANVVGTSIRLDWTDRAMNKIHEVQGASTSTSEGCEFEVESQRVRVVVSSIKNLLKQVGRNLPRCIRKNLLWSQTLKSRFFKFMTFVLKLATAIAIFSCFDLYFVYSFFRC